LTKVKENGIVVFIMRSVFWSLFTIGTVSIAVVIGTSAFFSDKETSTNNIFQAGEIDLTIEYEGY